MTPHKKERKEEEREMPERQLFNIGRPSGIVFHQKRFSGHDGNSMIITSKLATEDDSNYMMPRGLKVPLPVSRLRQAKNFFSKRGDQANKSALIEDEGASPGGIRSMTAMNDFKMSSFHSAKRESSVLSPPFSMHTDEATPKH